MRKTLKINILEEVPNLCKMELVRAKTAMLKIQTQWDNIRLQLDSQAPIPQICFKLFNFSNTINSNK
jgi:hypothetical protein